LDHSSIIYGAIDALAFAAGAALCVQMGILQWRSPQVTGGSRDLVILWICGGLWTLGCFTATMMRLSGAPESSVAVRVALTLAWSSSAIGPFITMRAAAASLDGRLPFGRVLTALGALASAGVLAALVWASLDPADDFALLEASLISFVASMAFLVICIAIVMRKRRPARPAAARQHSTMGRVILIFWAVWIALTLLNILTPRSEGVLARALSQVNQQWTIPVSILAALSVAKTHYADVVLKRSLAILLAIFGAAAVAWQIPGLPRGVPLVAVSLLAAALMLAAPIVWRSLGRAVDRMVLKRPDYPALARAYADEARLAPDSAALASLTETRIGEALGLDARFCPAEDAEVVTLEGGRPLALSPRLKAASLMSAEHAFLDAVGAELCRREDALAFEAERREREVREARLKAAVAEAELKALRAQVDPHFLFNTLNAIASLIATDPDRAEAMTERLAAFFRYTLDRQERTTATLDEELDFVRQYLEIEKVRFGDRLTVDIRKEKGLGKEAAPPLILQPLVENAIRHGLSSRLGGGRIEVDAARDGDRIRLTVSDDGVGFSPRSKPRVGLSNVRERLKALYGEAAAMTIGEGPGGKGASVVLTLPA
jgi:two-component system LytT family sensor kinase